MPSGTALRPRHADAAIGAWLVLDNYAFAPLLRQLLRQHAGDDVTRTASLYGETIVTVRDGNSSA